DDPALDGGDIALAQPEVIPVHAGLLHHAVQRLDLRNLGHVGGPGTVQVGDVGHTAAAYGGEDLLQRAVVVDVQAGDLLPGVQVLVLADQVGEGLALGTRVPFPDRDRLAVPARSAAAPRAAGHQAESNQRGP